jgi:type I restriction enzyme M protein
LVLKKCKKEEDVLFINASEHFEKGKRQNFLRGGDIERIVETYKNRPEKIERYASRVSMKKIEENDYNLNISRYVSTAVAEEKIDLEKVNAELEEIEKRIKSSTIKHNEYLKELGLKTI